MAGTLGRRWDAGARDRHACDGEPTRRGSGSPVPETLRCSDWYLSTAARAPEPLSALACVPRAGAESVLLLAVKPNERRLDPKTRRSRTTIRHLRVPARLWTAQSDLGTRRSEIGASLYTASPTPSAPSCSQRERPQTCRYGISDDFGVRLLLEREHQLGVLDDAVLAAVSGEGRAVAVQGPGAAASRAPVLAAAANLGAAVKARSWREGLRLRAAPTTASTAPTTTRGCPSMPWMK